MKTLTVVGCFFIALAGMVGAGRQLKKSATPPAPSVPEMMNKQVHDTWLKTQRTALNELERM